MIGNGGTQDADRHDLLLLKTLIKRHSVASWAPTSISGLALMRSESVSTCTIVKVYTPMIGIIVQGRKQLVLGTTNLAYDPGSYLISSIDLPISARITDATPTKPYLALTLQLDPKLLASVVVDLPRVEVPKSPVCGLLVSPISSAMLKAFVRLLQLLDSPADAVHLAPLILREIYYRLLTGEAATMLSRMVLPQVGLSQVIEAVSWIRHNYTKPLHIPHLANLANMSPASLHRQFKEVTAMSPLQYQKRLRLQEAQEIMVARKEDAAFAGFAVGYGSPSQFSREYHKMFGMPPRQHADFVLSEKGMSHVRELL